jgi:mannose-6-phosphate isomerase-like protein (cupin superfamily)
MYVFENSRQPRAGLPGITHTTLAARANGLERLSIWRQSVAAGGATPPHRHDCEEVVVVQSGHGDLRIGGAAHRFGPDTTLVIPPGADHQIVNTGSEPIELIAVFSATPVSVTLPGGEALDLPWAS